MEQKKKVLLFCFGVFGDYAKNSGLEVVKELAGKSFSQIELKTIVLPVVFQKAAQILLLKIKETLPAIVLGLGQAGRGECFYLERIAVNVNHSTITDNEEFMPKDQLINSDGPIGYWATLDYAPLLAALSEICIPVEVSFHAGTYVCNDIFYRLLDFAHRGKIPLQAGFIHIPSLEKNKMELETIVKGVEAVLTALES